MLEKNKKGTPTQQLVQIDEVRDGVVILPNNTIRSILIVSSLNFALKSEEEQNAIIYAYQGFLNSLDFPIQILVTSRKLDITPYIEELSNRKGDQTNNLLRLQMNEYINFVSELVKESNVMTKTFFVTVSFAVTESRQMGLLEKITTGLSSATGKKKTNISDAQFEHYKKQLMQRVEQVAVGLRNIGLRVAPLQTQEVLELFYNTLNPTTSRNMKLADVSKLKTKETRPPEIASNQSNIKPWASNH